MEAINEERQEKPKRRTDASYTSFPVMLIVGGFNVVGAAMRLGDSLNSKNLLSIWSGRP